MNNSIHVLQASRLIVVTVLMLLIYTSVQQSYRTSANDPQIQIAGDIANRLSDGKPVDHFFTSDTIDLKKSLSPFIVLYNNNRQPVRTTGYLDGRPPQLPAGVLEYAAVHGEDQVTWQPEKEVRIAMVVKKISSLEVAYVAVGRSLSQVEIRTGNLTRMVLIAWAVVIITIVLSWGVQIYFLPK